MITGLFVLVFLSACQPFFPIAGISSDHGEYFPLLEPIRIFFSIIWYEIFLGILATFPLLILGKFKNNKFYYCYSLFWRIGIFIYVLLSAVLVGYIPRNFEELISFNLIGFMGAILILSFFTLFPAYLQNKWNKTKTNN